MGITGQFSSRLAHNRGRIHLAASQHRQPAPFGPTLFLIRSQEKPNAAAKDGDK